MSTPSTFLLWIDGVGCYQVVRSSNFTIGGPTSQQKIDPSHLSLLADLSKTHASFLRSQNGYLLTPSGPIKLDHQIIQGTNKLGNKHQLLLGNKVEFNWTIPHVLSQTAVLEFISDHRPKRRIDGIIWMDQFFALGNGNSAHIQCPAVNNNYFLYFNQSTLHVKPEHESQREVLTPNGIYTRNDLQFRYEVI